MGVMGGWEVVMGARLLTVVKFVKLFKKFFRADQTPQASRRAMGAVPDDSPEVPRGRKEARPARPHTRVSLGRSLGVSPAAVKIALP